MTKLVKFGEEARNELKKGVAFLNKATGSTLGASGRSAIIDSVDGFPFITADGITIAQNIDLEEPVAQIGLALARNASLTANQKAGDGSTTTICLINSMLTKDNLIKGLTPSLVKSGMEKAIQDVYNHLDEHKHEVNGKEDLHNLATISSRGDSVIGNLIAEAFEHTGKDGQVIVVDSYEGLSKVETINGYQIDKGYYSEYFINNKKRNIVEYENPLVFLTDIPLDNYIKVATLLEKYNHLGRPSIFISPEISEPVQTMLVTNTQLGKIKACFIEAPEYGLKQADVLNDLAFSIGATAVLKEKGGKLSDFEETFLGNCTKVMAQSNMAVFLSDKKSQLEDYNYVENLIPNESDSKWIEFRKKRLTGKLGKITVGSNSMVEMKEKRDRVEDAVNAVKCALDEGYIAGGGIALFRAYLTLEAPSELNESEKAGYNLIKESLIAPLRQILFNVYESESTEKDGNIYKFEDVIEQLKPLDYNIGFDSKNRVICNMLESGIIDPIKVTKSALEAAYSVASTILNTNCIVAITGTNGDLKLH